MLVRRRSLMSQDFSANRKELQKDFDVIETVKRYAEVVRGFMPVKMVILYGSYARGTARPYSDIDVAVVVEKFKGD